MTMILEQAARPSHATIAGGVATFYDIARAGRDSMLYVDNANAAHEALDRALEERIAAIHAATGEKLENPLRQADRVWRQRQLELQTVSPFSPAWKMPSELKTLESIREEYLSAFEQKLFDLDGRWRELPAARQAIGAGRPVSDDAARIARQADADLARLLSSRPGIGKWAALLGGGLAGSLNDPVTLLSLGLGAGPGAARTVAGRVLSVAGKEALINAATEAAIEPAVQAWREKAGLDHGLGQALTNVLFAGALGGVFGGGIGAAGEGLRALRRHLRPDQVERGTALLAEEQARLSEPARAMIAGDGLKAADSLAEIREHLPPAARGALDAADGLRHADELKPAAASPAAHDRAMAEADAAVRLADLETVPTFEPDPAQVERVVRAIAGRSPVRQAQDEAGSLIDFLIDRGGLRDTKGELKTIGAYEVARPFRGGRRRAPAGRSPGGRLVSETGDTLDYAREAAAEAGFFDHKYGTPEEAVARSTVADLLDAVEEEIRSGPAAARFATAQDEAALSRLESAVHEIARLGGPALDDRLLERAARLTLDGADPFDALERVLIQEELDSPSKVRGGDAAPRQEPLPGWSDEELIAASENRGSVPEPDGLDEPGRIEPDDTDLRELAALPEDALIPTEDGLVSASELLAGIERQENLLRVTQACRA